MRTAESLTDWDMEYVFAHDEEPLKLVGEASKYRLDILGISSTKLRNVETVDLPERWKLFCSGVDPATPARAGVAILTSSQLTGRVLEIIP